MRYILFISPLVPRKFKKRTRKEGGGKGGRKEGRRKDIKHECKKLEAIISKFHKSKP